MTTSDQLAALVAAWKVANRNAAAAENLLAEASHLHATGAGPAPDQALVDETTMLRDAADQLLKDLVARLLSDRTRH